MISRRRLLETSLGAAASALAAEALPQEPKMADGLYAELHTSKGLIVAKLAFDLTPMTVANFVGLAEGSIANSAFDPGQPFFDGTVYHRVVPGHVIQCGVPKSDRSRGPGYTFPNEIHAGLSHNHAGAVNMANGGPNTNASQFCIMLGDRSYLDFDYTVFGDVTQGLDNVMRIVQGDVIERVRILRIGAAAEAFRPTTESFQAQVKAAEERVLEHVAKKRTAEADWIARNYPQAAGPEDGIRTQQLQPGGSTAAPASAFRYRGKELRYMGLVIGRQGPPIDAIEFASTNNGTPAFEPMPVPFSVEPGKTKVNPGLDTVLAAMKPGERKIVILPPALAYKTAGFYAPEIPGKRRFVVSPNTMLVYDIEALGA